MRMKEFVESLKPELELAEQHDVYLAIETRVLLALALLGGGIWWGIVILLEAGAPTLVGDSSASPTSYLMVSVDQGALDPRLDAHQEQGCWRRTSGPSRKRRRSPAAKETSVLRRRIGKRSCLLCNDGVKEANMLLPYRQDGTTH